MRPRTEPLRAVDRPGHLFVDIPGKGRHDLRLPTASQTVRVSAFYSSRPPDGSVWEYYGVLIGLAWRHDGRELEAVYPLDDPSAGNLIRYSEAVLGELEEAGYTSGEQAILGRALVKALTDRAAERAEAVALAGNSSPPLAATSSP